MLKIAVCDDEKELTAELERALMIICANLTVAHEIDLYYSAADLCRCLDAGARYDMLFLDIAFAKDDINGVEAGRLIRGREGGSLISIVYISWTEQYAMELFELNPLHFLLKPLDYGKVEKAIKTHIENNGISGGIFTWQKGRDSYKARVKDILYLESHSRKITIHFNDGKSDEFYGSLKELYHEQLESFDFLFIHTSYLVSYDAVTAACYDYMAITGREMPLPVSRPRRNKVRQRYTAIRTRRRGV